MVGAAGPSKGGGGGMWSLVVRAFSLDALEFMNSQEYGDRGEIDGVWGGDADQVQGLAELGFV